MNNCKTCGAELKQGQNFCGECGAEVSWQPDKGPKKQSFQFNRKTLILSGIAAAIIVFLIGGYMIGSSLTGKDKAVKAFTDALENQDKAAVLESITTEESDWKISKKDIEGFFTYLKENPETKKTLIANIRQQSETDAKAESDSDFELSGLFTLKKAGKKWLLFDNYKFAVTPFHLEAETNYEGTKISVNGEEAAVSKSTEEPVEIGPLFPGTHTVKAVWQGEYAQLEKETTVTLIDQEEPVSEVDFDLDGQMIHLDSNFEDAAVYIDGEKTDLTVGDVDELGPFSSDSDIAIHAEKAFPWGTVKSDEVPVSDGSYLDLDISPFTDEMKQGLIDQVNEYAVTWAEAYKQMDASKLEGLVTDSFLKGIEEDIQEMKDDGRRWKGKAVKNEIDMDSFNVGTNDQGKSTVEINLMMYWDSTYYDEGNKEKAETEEDKDLLGIILVYDEEKKQWFINDEEGMMFYMAGEMKTFELD
ncbi:zinc ribbon domain-containing protein [Virgibacillus doumboii]|uniref:zinc ribbon domain-containing protein n=1 Tax=Virgibacillus doumboii TaxID=2697503 RepID=UPI0013E0357E|nr:hypothetical protein [Virgibacillus doumboii]